MLSNIKQDYLLHSGQSVAYTTLADLWFIIFLLFTVPFRRTRLTSPGTQPSEGVAGFRHRTEMRPNRKNILQFVTATSIHSVRSWSRGGGEKKLRFRNQVESSQAEGKLDDPGRGSAGAEAPVVYLCWFWSLKEAGIFWARKSLC